VDFQSELELVRKMRAQRHAPDIAPAADTRLKETP
jgi:alpha-D-ribose 1-methylphosphonate 5-triphosphate synthase subunit PhnI